MNLIAIEIGAIHNTLVAKVLSSDGLVSALPIEDLYKAGLPSAEVPRKIRFEADFSTWDVVPSEEYFNAFGYRVPNEDASKHRVFETTWKNLRLQVPALAVMRALVRPTRWLLPEAFRPQVLDRTTNLIPSDTGWSVEIKSYWAWPSRDLRQRHWKAALRWMRSYPSAERMVNSIYPFARAGEIALNLPHAIATLTAYGHQVGDVLYVTELSASKLAPSDTPYFDLAGVTPDIVLHANVNDAQDPTPRLKTSNYCVPLHANESVELTDAEWSKVTQALSEGAHPLFKNALPRNRGVINGILCKLSTGVPWRKLHCTQGNWSQASYTYQQLAHSGKLDKLLAVIREMRQPPQVQS